MIDRHYKSILILILIISALVRLYGLDRMALWGDEACMVYLCQQQPASIIAALASTDRPDVDVAPPLYFLLLHYWMRIWGSSVLAFRGFSVFFGVMTVWGVTALSKTLLDRRTAILAGCFAAIHPFQVWYSQEGRMYSLAAFLAVMTMQALAHALNHRERPVAWIPFGFWGIALAYTQYYGLLLLFALSIHAVIRIRSEKDRSHASARCFAGVLFFWLIAYSPWLPVLAGDYTHAGAPGGFPLMFHGVITPVFLFTKAVMFGLEMYIRDYLWLYPIPLIVAAVCLLKTLRAFRDPGVGLPMVSVIIPFIVVYTLSLTGLRVYKSHPFIIFHPAFIVLLSTGCLRMSGFLRHAAVFILITAQTTVLATLVWGGEYVKPRVDEVVNWIDERTGDGSTVAVIPAFVPNPMPIVGDLLAFRYHSGDRMNTLYLTGSSAKELVDSIQNHAINQNHLYLVYQQNMEIDDIVQEVRAELSKNWREEEVRFFPSRNRGFSMAVVRYEIRPL